MVPTPVTYPMKDGSSSLTPTKTVGGFTGSTCNVPTGLTGDPQPGRNDDLYTVDRGRGSTSSRVTDRGSTSAVCSPQLPVRLFPGLPPPVPLADNSVLGRLGASTHRPRSHSGRFPWDP